MRRNGSVSVVITAYNVEECLDRAVCSVLDQTYRNLEIIIVEDCSTDRTGEVADRFRFLSNVHVRVIHNPHNMGAGKSRQTGLDNASGDWVMFLDGDDWLDSDCLERLVETADTYDADMCSCNLKIEYPGRTVVQDRGFQVLEGDNRFLRVMENPIKFLNYYIIRRQLFDLVKYCPRRFIEDSPVLLKLLYYSRRVVFAGFAGYHYFQRDSSLCGSASPVKRNIFTILAIMDVMMFFRRHCPEYIGKLKLLDGLYSEFMCLDGNLRLYGMDEECRKEYEFINRFKEDLTMACKKGKGKGKKGK